MTIGESTASYPLTIDVGQDLLGQISTFQNRCGAISIGKVMRSAFRLFNFNQYESVNVFYEQILIRISVKLRDNTIGFIRKYGVIFEELICASLDAQPKKSIKWINQT